MNQKDKPFNLKSIDDVYNYVEVGHGNNQNPHNMIRPEHINIVKDNDSEIVLVMSYKKTNNEERWSRQDTKKNYDENQSTENNRNKLASTIKYLTKGIGSDDCMTNKNDSMEQNLRGIFNNSQNPHFKPPPIGLDEIRSTDTLTSNNIRNMTESIKSSRNYDDRLIRPLGTKSQFFNTLQKTKIPLPNRLTGRDKRNSTPVTPPINKIPIQQRYFALCIPNVRNDPNTVAGNDFKCQSLRYFNPNIEEFKKPSKNELVVVPVNLVTKPDDQHMVAGDSNSTKDHHKPDDKIELTLEELHTIVKLVKERNII